MFVIIYYEEPFALGVSMIIVILVGVVTLLFFSCLTILSTI